MPGERAGYHLQCGMIVLAEIVRRIDGRRFETYVRDEVFEPLGMPDCWVGMPADVAEGYGERIGTMHSTVHRASRSRSACSTRPDALARCSPGGGGRGPLRQLGRLYEALLGRGELDGRRVVLAADGRGASPRTTASASTTRRSTRECDWGLGFAVDAYAMGRHASPRSFGHGGALSAISFADPEHGLVAVVQTNGMCGNDDHYLRLDAVTTALYEDLGLVAVRLVRTRQAVPLGRAHRCDRLIHTDHPPQEKRSTMADWQPKKVDDVQAGDVVRYAGQEFTVARVDAPFLGRDEMVCFIEDTPDRWHAYPAALGGDVEVQV